MESNYLLQLKKIYKSFGGLRALHDVNLDLRYQEVLGLVGDNAAGKSTLMKILTGAYHADHGTFLFEGNEVTSHSPHVSKQLGIEMVYQNFELCPNLDVPSNLFLGRELTSSRTLFQVLKKKAMEEKAVRELRKLKIDIQNPKMRVDKLSGGQQQAVAIGKAVSFNPKLVIMDEPTANLAQMEIDKVLELTLRLKDHNISVIFISHRLDDVFRVSDRIFVLKGGCSVVVKETSTTNKNEILKLMFMGKNG